MFSSLWINKVSCNILSTYILFKLFLCFSGHKVLSDEVSPGTLVNITIPDGQAESSRFSAVMQNCHPTVCLSG